MHFAKATYFGCALKGAIILEDIRQSPYAEWLEMILRDIMEQKPKQIGICMILNDGAAATAYWGDVSHADKMSMSNHMMIDGMYDVVLANADQIVAAAEEMEDDDE